MKTINLLKAGAVLTASAFLLSVSVYDFKGVLSDDTYNKKSDAILPVVTVLENTTSSDYETANVQLLLNAYEEKNNEDMAVICDKLLESIEASKKEFEQTSQIVAEWNNDAITARLEKYQNEFNCWNYIRSITNNRRFCNCFRNCSCWISNITRFCK